ncbi:MAG: GGDEF domain-containing phosphodiesterase [Sediminimonas sp.]|uniref:GGDEF domain-containing phosphodiesterase n=1 Tax=Sediminimonas sp. TaxID=2823379 RepID=UPI00286FB24A|nr:GGDEF domain-containing phosphodiesterase [Sediminimonas sp.]MDR9484835.1 GGDEF domain-containing phosphodiesterase [Sediminimonas sp.]
MKGTYNPPMGRSRRYLAAALTGPQVLAFMPALSLGAFWFGGEAWLLATALGLPALYALVGSFSQTAEDEAAALGGNPECAAHALDHAIQNAARDRKATACLVVAMDDADHLRRNYGGDILDTVTERCLSRLPGVLRQGDQVFAVADEETAIALAPVPRLDLETLIQLSARVQSALEEPVSVDATAVSSSWSVGFCLGSRNPGDDGADLLQAARAALADARRNGPSAIRAHTGTQPAPATVASDLCDEPAQGLEAGQFRPWFQPQLCTDTGRVSGFEALARWQHPVQGIIPPAVFLPVLEKSGNLERLAHEILRQSMEAIKHWDREEVKVPRVAVNLSAAELSNPTLADRVAWELDRFDVSPGRLTLEVLETVVVPSGSDVVTRNINALADLGCTIDLDDFGTGHASIASLRRFKVSRIKIDRSFVAGVDRDAKQQRMITAILTMADQLGLDALAEGVETTGEHAVLAQLGCRHVQGFGIARPMPLDQTADWVRHHERKLGQPTGIGRATG